jgi:hypothetical protein
VNATAARDADRVNAESTPSAQLQHAAKSWADPYVASGDLGDEIAKFAPLLRKAIEQESFARPPRRSRLYAVESQRQTSHLGECQHPNKRENRLGMQSCTPDTAPVSNA